MLDLDQTSEIHSVVRQRFVPLAVETLGALGEEAATFFRDIGRRIAVAAGEPRSTQFLFQRLSIAIQRGNAASDGCLDDVFYL